jgi:hypothetical protein
MNNENHTGVAQRITAKMKRTDAMAFTGTERNQPMAWENHRATTLGEASPDFSRENGDGIYA